MILEWLYSKKLFQLKDLLQSKNFAEKGHLLKIIQKHFLQKITDFKSLKSSKLNLSNRKMVSYFNEK